MISIDATNTERKGKYIKDEEVGSPLNNCVMRLLVTENYPRLCLFANRDIKAGEELRYDYGEANLPWRQIHLMIIHLMITHLMSTRTVRRTMKKLLILKQRVKKKLMMIPTLHPPWKVTVTKMSFPCKSKKLSTERSSCPPHAKPEAQGQVSVQRHTWTAVERHPWSDSLITLSN
uniref:SET domain-containing protein n=1 Tax=Magallana gigas TaxID=29159 RepID=A0A8W8JRM4_MAGGI